MSERCRDDDKGDKQQGGYPGENAQDQCDRREHFDRYGYCRYYLRIGNAQAAQTLRKATAVDCSTFGSPAVKNSADLRSCPTSRAASFTCSIASS